MRKLSGLELIIETRGSQRPERKKSVSNSDVSIRGRNAWLSMSKSHNWSNYPTDKDIDLRVFLIKSVPEGKMKARDLRRCAL
jgi:hypothetical protein